MEFSKIAAPSLKDLFIRQIEDLIISGKLEIGSQLPAERELAERMGVSRTVVNAGIAEMSGKGFLEIRPRIGIFVTDFRRSGKIGAILSLMTYNGGALRRAEIRSILEIRLALDRLSIETVVEKASDEEINGLEPHLERIRVAESPTACAAALYDYHHEFSVIAQNTIIPLIYSSFAIPITSLWERYCRLYGRQTLYEGTQRLHELVKARRKDEAVAWVEEYIGTSLSGTRQIYSE
ncbi:MAG: GntR family transcriptional regulator [Treponemataceae bacterium]